MSLDTTIDAPAPDARGHAAADAAALRAEASALLASGDVRAALAAVERAVLADEGDADALVLRADCRAALGDLAGATDDLAQVVSLGKAGPDTLDRLGCRLQELGLFDQAVVCHVRAVDAAPPERHPELYLHLGAAMLGQGNHKAAVELFEAVLAARPADAKAALSLSGALLQMKDYRRAAEVCRAALEAVDTTELRHNLGTALSMMPGEKEAAADAFRRAVELDPGNGHARHMLSVASGERMEAMPGEIVAGTFDGYASYYDADMVEKLRYRVPGLVRRALLDPFYGKRRFGAILDVGCGTGLVGLMVRDVTDHLKGVDVSRNMLLQAASKNLYDGLEVADVNESLGTDDRLYDAAVAADVCGYIGRLDGLAAKIFARLAPGGLFVFSVERHPTEDYAVLGSGRFAHSRDYVKRTVEQAGFLVRSMAPERLRVNAGLPVEGIVVVAQRP
jgi:predicted TPR repeat methyltransferase